jgi:hypothetical protein
MTTVGVPDKAFKGTANPARLRHAIEEMLASALA